LAKEIEIIGDVLKKPKKPFVFIMGGAKISTKIDLINRLIEIADYLLIGGGLANTFLCAQEYNIGKSFCEYREVNQAKKLLFLAAQKNTAVILPSDVVIGDPKNTANGGEGRKIDAIPDKVYILDIGPETQAQFGAIIAKAKTIIWNGPVGYFENPHFKRGTDFIYYAITHNKDAVSIVGGGDTLAAISKEEYLHKITHISTGGGAMLEFIEKGTLPGIQALQFRD
jgi:phosphoglycerate kinase